MAGRPTTATNALATSTWGRRLLIRPGVEVADGGLGIGPDIGKPIRLLDVRAPGYMPGQSSRSYTVYATAKAIFDEGVFAPSGIRSRDLIGILETGSGGVTRAEEFRMPAHGKAIHIGADSVRLSMVYRPSVDTPIDSIPALIGFECQANVSVTGLYPGVDREDSNLFADNDPLLPTPQVFRIPQFAETLQFIAASPSSYELQWLDQFDVVQLESPFTSGSDFAEPQPIPLNSVSLSVRPTAPVGVQAAVQLSWGRPS